MYLGFFSAAKVLSFRQKIAVIGFYIAFLMAKRERLGGYFPL
jgi:hypothetical protein